MAERAGQACSTFATARQRPTRRGCGTAPVNGKIRVLFTQSHPDFSPTAAVHRLLMRQFDPERVEVHLACTSEAEAGPTDSLHGIPAIPHVLVRPTRFGPTIYRKSTRDVARSAVRDGLPAAASLAGLVAYTKRHRIDVVHFAERPRDAFYGHWLGRATGAKTVFHLHLEPADWMGPRVQWAMRNADGLICVSEHVARIARDRGLAAQRTHVVLNGIDLARWDPATDGSAIRREFGISPDELVVSIVSRIVPSKGHEQLLDALARLRDRIPPFRLLIVGADDPAVLPPGFSEVAALRDQAQRLGIAERVVFTGRRLDVPELLAASDIHAMPSSDEAFGLAFVEAMAMGLPVVAVDAGGTSEVVEHGRTGLISAIRDPDQLAKHIAMLATDPEMRRAMGRAGRARVEHQFTASRMARQVEEVYRSLLSAPARGG